MTFDRGPLAHHGALGIHPGAFRQPTAPDPVALGLQDGVLWIDTSVAEPYPLREWEASAGVWRDVGRGATGPPGPAGAPGPAGPPGADAIVGGCITFPLGAQLCNPSTDLVTLVTPTGLHQWDPTGYTLPGGHRLETVPA